MVAVVTGASGITGSHCVQRLCGSPDFQQIVSLSRRELDLEGISDKVKQVHVDLGDKGKLDQGLSSLGATLQEGKARVYIFHCAYVSTGDPFKDCEANRGMLENTVEAVGEL